MGEKMAARLGGPGGWDQGLLSGQIMDGKREGRERRQAPVATFTVEGVPHALVAARLAAEEAIGVRHGCFCAHPYLMRLLGLSREQVLRYRAEVRHRDRSAMPGAVRASAGLNTTGGDITRLLNAMARIARGHPPPVPYRQDPRSGDFHPCGSVPGLTDQPGTHSARCLPG